YGKEGVLALFQDSTNVERSGYTPSERAVRTKFEEVFHRTKRRLFISCFSSSTHRIKLAMEMAFQHNRKVALVGRSMTEATEIAIYRVVEHLVRREANVIYEDGSWPPVHVSGHASQEELRLIINLVKPKFFIPIHGEYRQLRRHLELAKSMHGAVGQALMIE